MIIFSSSPRNQLPNHGRKAGDKFSVFPNKNQQIPLTATSDSSSVSQLFTEELAAQPLSEGR